MINLRKNYKLIKKPFLDIDLSISTCFFKDHWVIEWFGLEGILKSSSSNPWQGHKKNPKKPNRNKNKKNPIYIYILKPISHIYNFFFAGLSAYIYIYIYIYTYMCTLWFWSTRSISTLAGSNILCHIGKLNWICFKELSLKGLSRAMELKLDRKCWLLLRLVGFFLLSKLSGTSHQPHTLLSFNFIFFFLSA